MVELKVGVTGLLSWRKEVVLSVMRILTAAKRSRGLAIYRAITVSMGICEHFQFYTPSS